MTELTQLADLNFEPHFTLTVWGEDRFRSVIFRSPRHNQALRVIPTEAGWQVTCVVETPVANATPLVKVLRRRAR